MSSENARGFVKARVNEARLARQWSAVAAGLDRQPPRARWPVVLATATVLLIVLGMGWRFIGSRVNPGLEGAVLESHESSMLVSLADGSRIELDPRSELAVRASRSDRTDLDVRSGGASFDVAHVAGRTFQVSFAGVQVTVVGTRFSVRERRLASGERQVEVSVSRGLVEARSGDVHVKLGAGQSWSAPVEGSRAAPAVLAPSGVPSDAPSAPAPRAAPAVADAGAASVTEPSLGTISEPVPASPSEPALLPQSSPRVRTDAREPHAEPESPDAKALFEEANRARAAGNVAAAAQGYQAMLARYPRDPRAALAAFELGRLQMDRLGQPGQALGSLKRAVASASRGGFREDAMARIVSAYAASGATAACLRAQRAYLKQYPNGIHRATVQAQCGARVSP